MAHPLNPSLHQCTVLLSGGLDSAACVSFYLEHRFLVSAIHFSYGQAAESNELRAARSIASYSMIKASWAKKRVRKVCSRRQPTSLTLLSCYDKGFLGNQQQRQSDDKMSLSVKVRSRHALCSQAPLRRDERPTKGFNLGRFRDVLFFSLSS